MVGCETDKEANDIQATLFVAINLVRNVRSSSTKGRAAQWAIEKPKLDNAR